MSETRLENLKIRLVAYEKAELAILDGAQSYSIGSRSLTRASLPEIRKAIEELERSIASEKRRAAGGRIYTIGVIPRDF